MNEIRPRFNESERKVMIKALALALKQSKEKDLSDDERKLVSDIRERLQHPGSAKRGQALAQEDYPVRGEGVKDDNEIASLLRKEYHATELKKIGAGKKMDFWCAITRWRGEPRLLFLTVNPNNGYVGGFYALPCEVMEELGEFIKKMK